MVDFQPHMVIAGHKDDVLKSGMPLSNSSDPVLNHSESHLHNMDMMQYINASSTGPGQPNVSLTAV